LGFLAFGGSGSFLVFVLLLGRGSLVFCLAFSLLRLGGSGLLLLALGGLSCLLGRLGLRCRLFRLCSLFRSWRAGILSWLASLRGGLIVTRLCRGSRIGGFARSRVGVS
jgi:hypothetical protein